MGRERKRRICPRITRTDANGGKRVREVGAALRERRGTCWVAAMKRVFLRGVPRLGVKALSKLTVTPKGAVGPR